MSNSRPVLLRIYFPIHAPRGLLVNIVILAAGMGKRMHSDLPKVLHPVAGRPMLAHVIDTARALSPSRLVVVIGHGAQHVREAVAADDVAFAEQSQQLAPAMR